MPGRQFVRYYRFPKNAELSKQWVIRLKRDQWVPSLYSKVCSDHFFDSDFTERSLHKVISANSGHRVQLLLEQGAIPNYDPRDDESSQPGVSMADIYQYMVVSVPLLLFCSDIVLINCGSKCLGEQGASYGQGC